MTVDARLFSLVVPVMNEEEVLADTYATLQEILQTIDMPYEVIVVDNGSTDRSPEIMRSLCQSDSRWKYIRLSRNFGYQNSITAGMCAAAGDAIMVIDCDLQDPPELIPEFIAKWREGNDVVYGVRSHRTGESLLRIFPTMMAMRVISWMSDDVKLPLHSSDFRLISRRVRDAYQDLPETTRYVRGLIHWLGFRQVGVPYVRRGRLKGESKVNWRYLVDFTFNAISNFSVRPMRMFSIFGASILTLTGVLAVVYAALSFFLSPPPGLTTVLILLLANLGLTSLGFGVVGEYIGKIYMESKRRPLWLVDYSVNIAPPTVTRQPASEVHAPDSVAIRRAA